MTTWGVDLGARSYHAAGISASGHLELFTYQINVTGKVADQSIWARAEELTSLGLSIAVLMSPGDDVFIEEPPRVNNTRTLLKLAQAAAALSVGAMKAGARATFVPVDSWKKGTIGRGGASKELVSDWLTTHHPAYAAQCGGSQDLRDAVCLALYGRHIGTTAAGGLDQPHIGLAAG